SGQDSGATLAYSVDGAAFAASYNPAALTDGLHEGAHTIQVRATDAAGNQNTSAHTNVPHATKEAQPRLVLANDTTDGGAGHNTAPSLHDALPILSGQDSGATLAYSVDGAAFAASYNPAALTDGLHEGAHTIQVRATDAAGNQ